MPLDKITPDPNQPRKYFDEEGIKQLAQNIKVEGIIHPIEVDEAGMIIVGERRYRAAKLLGLKEMPVTINKTKMTPYERLRRQMSENLQQSSAKSGGEGMKYLDTAKAWVKMYELKTGLVFGAEHQLQDVRGIKGVKGVFSQIADEVGVSKTTVWELLQLLDEPEFIQEKVNNKEVPRTFIYEANRAPEEIREELKQQVVDGKVENITKLREIIYASKAHPELVRGQLEHSKISRSYETNAILNRVTGLALALDKQPLSKVDIKERGIVVKQLEWLQDAIDKYLG